MPVFTKRFRSTQINPGTPGLGGNGIGGTPINYTPQQSDPSLHDGNFAQGLTPAQQALLGYEDDGLDRLLAGVSSYLRGTMGSEFSNQYRDYADGLGLSADQVDNILNTRASLRSGTQQAYYGQGGLQVVNAGTDPGQGYSRIGGKYNNPGGGAYMKNPIGSLKKRAPQPKPQTPQAPQDFRKPVPRGNYIDAKAFRGY